MPFASLFAVVAFAATAFLHPPPRVFVTVAWNEAQVGVSVLGHRDLWQRWLEMDEPLLPDSSAQARELAGERALEFMKAQKILIDGQRVIAHDFQIRTSDQIEGTHEDPVCEIELIYTCDQAPRRIELIWERFDGTEDEGPPMVRGLVHTEDGSSLFALRPEEPQYTWHAPLTPPKVDQWVLESLPDSETGKEEIRVSVLSLVSGILGLVTVILVRRKSWLPVMAVLIFGGGVWVAWPHSQITLYEVESKAPPPLTDFGAFQLFEVMHGNLYRAFGANSEEKIYELLAQSVHPSILDELYSDMYESLILRDQGGAVCAIESVDVHRKAMLGQGIEVGDHGEKEFRMRWGWQVHGVVSHWGHVHRRVHDYDAVYTIRQFGRSWRIAGVEILSSYRVSAEDPLPLDR